MPPFFGEYVQIRPIQGDRDADCHCGALLITTSYDRSTGILKEPQIAVSVNRAARPTSPRNRGLWDRLYVVINPGDFIFGDSDGLQVIPKDYVDEVLLKVEEIFTFEEERERDLIANGMPIDDVYKRFGDL